MKKRATRLAQVARSHYINKRISLPVRGRTSHAGTGRQTRCELYGDVALVVTTVTTCPGVF